MCGAIHPYSSTRQRRIGDHSMDLSCSDDDDESSSAEDLDVNVCSVSDDEISHGTVRDSTVSTRQTPGREGSVEKHVREGASPMRKRRRLSVECTGIKSPSFSGNKEDHSKISQDTPTCSGLQFNDILDLTSMSPGVLFALSDAFLGGVTVTSQGSADIAKQWTSKKESETISIDSDSASEASVELIKSEIKPDQMDLKRRPIAKREKSSKSENYTSSESGESLSVASTESPSKQKQDLSTTTKERGIDVVEADSSAFSIKVEEGREPASEVNLPVSDSKQNLVDSDEDSCIITNVLKRPCPVGNDKFGMKCSLECCNPISYCDFHQSLTSVKRTMRSCMSKDLQITTVSSSSGTICDHFKEKTSQVMGQNLLLDQASAVADKEEKGDVCSVGTNTLPFKPSSRKELPATQTTTQTLFPKGKTPVSSSGRNKRLNLRKCFR